MLRKCSSLFNYISLEQVVNIVKAKQAGHPSASNILLVDVRSTGEVAKTGVIPTAVNIPLPILADILDEDAPDSIDDEEFAETFGVGRPERGETQLVFYCAHGIRSAMAVEMSEQLGYSGAFNFSGSWAQWAYTFVDQRDGTAQPTPTKPDA